MDFFASDKYVLPEKGDLLVSEPYLPDPNFERSVILICEHDENGSIGFVMNKEADVQVDDVVEQLGGKEVPLYVGGPVQQDTLHFIHQLDQLQDGAVQINEQLYWGGDFEQVQQMLSTGTLDEQAIRFFIGYSGWSPGQLEKELEEKAWIVCKRAPGRLLFEPSPKDLWKVVLEKMGGKFKVISNYPTDPRMN